MTTEITAEAALTTEKQSGDAATVAAGKAVATDLIIDSKDGNKYHVVRNELS